MDLDTQKIPESHALSRQAVFWLAALASLPVITALVSFRPDGQFAIWQAYARQLWLPAQIFEVATIMIAFAYGASIRRFVSYLSPQIRLVAAIWFAAMILAMAFSERPNLALFSLISWTLHCLFAFSTVYLFRKGFIGTQWQASAATWIAFGSAAFGLLTMAFIAIVGLDADYDWISSLPGFPNIRHSGYFLMAAMALSVGMIAVGDRSARNTHMVLLAINLGFTCWIGSRGPLFMFVATLIIAVLLFAHMRRARALGMVLVATVSGILLSQLVPTPDSSTFNAIMRIEESKFGDADQLSSGRTEIWRDTFSAIKKQPILGHGGNQFRLAVPAARKTYNQPHNSILQFTYDWGVIGAGALLAMLLTLGWRLVVTARQAPETWIPNCLAAISMAIYSLIDGIFYYNLPIMLFLTFALGSITRQSTSANPAEVSRVTDEQLTRKTQLSLS